MTHSGIYLDENEAAIRAHIALSLQTATTTTSTTTTTTTIPNATARSIPSATTTAPSTASTESSQNNNNSNNNNNNKATATAAAVAPYDRWMTVDDAQINYGYFAKTGGRNPSSSPATTTTTTTTTNDNNNNNNFYLTTAINYTNGPAHMGHAYEAATADAIARFARVKGTGAVYFVTGADEHGQKIANTAAAEGKEPIEICDKYVTGFLCLNQRILISNDDYIRTTSERHKRTARALWNKCHDNGDIYLDTYSGWYNIREETFVTESEAKLLDYMDPTSGQPLKQVQEASYFFRMSKYQARLIQYIEDNPQFIRPDHHRNLILARLRDDELRDLSISRTTFTWGIPVPKGFDAQHVMYVWVDALSNYLTGVDALQVEEGGSTLSNFWPANVHIIGKDILWFHTVIWPCLLMSAQLPLPKCVFAHGFVNDKEGKKMSKSLGNVVDPHDMLDKYSVDAFRWYLCKEAPYGGELAFNEDSLRDMYNADLNDTIGNLVHRATNLCGKFCGGVVPNVPAPPNPPVNFTDVCNAYLEKMNNLELAGGASVAIQGFRDVNRYLDEEAPWNKKGDEYAEARQIAVRATLEAIYALAHLLLPFIPAKGPAIFQKLHTEPVTLAQLDGSCRNLKVGTPIEVGDVLYNKILSAEELVNSQEASKSKQEAYLEAQKRKKEKKTQEAAASRAAQEGTNQPEFTKIDIRVGKIVEVWHHESADKLFCERIDVGEEAGPREIASGLREHYTLEEMKDRSVLVVCNLKPAKMVGFTSSGMVLAAKGESGKVELIGPPEGAAVGERVFIEGLVGEPWTAAQVKKKKTWETVAEGLKTGEGGVATWNGQVIQTVAGPCAAPTLVGAPIS